MLDWLQLKSILPTRKLGAWVTVLVIGVLLLAACGESDDPPPTELVIIPGNTAVVGDNPELEQTIIAMQATNFALQSTLIAIQSGETSTENQTPVDATVEATLENAEVGPTELLPEDLTITPMPTETLPPSAFPTPRAEVITVVEQVFEQGRMLWFRESRRVWVLVGDDVDPERGEWLCFEDTYLDSEIEFDPEFNPTEGTTTVSAFPDAVVQQPIRGFGKLWRGNDELREQVGWALASEVEHSARRDYLAGGTLDSNDEYVPGPGEWRIHSFYGGTLILLEDELGSDCPSGTWRLRQTS
jgi:hypothetical protein